MSQERGFFTELLGDLDHVPVADLMTALTEIANGTTAFGPADEWRDWFFYLLPRLVPRVHESTTREQLLEYLANAVFAVHPLGLDDGPYLGFREDVLATLGHALMDAERWPAGVLDVELGLNRHLSPRSGLWGWNNASGPLSASMFLCLKYLRHEEIGPWLTSVFEIEDPHWRALVMSWLLGAHPVLAGAERQPDRFEKLYPDIQWAWSHCFNGNYPGVDDVAPIDFISTANLDAAMLTVRSYFTEAAMLDWIEAFARDPSVEAELAAIPLWFLEAYFPSRPPA